MPVLGQNLPQMEMGQRAVVAKEERGHEEIWTKLVGRANEDKSFINGQPVTALLDTGSQVNLVNQDFFLANGIKINLINQLINIEEDGRTPLNMLDILKLNYPSLWEPICFEIEALLLVLPTTEYQKRLPVAIGTTITDMAVDFMTSEQS